MIRLLVCIALAASVLAGCSSAAGKSARTPALTVDPAASTASAPAAIAWPTAVPSPTPQPEIVLPPPSEAPPLGGVLAPPPVSASAAVVLDGASGALLYGKGADDVRAPASLTKIATAVIALERGRLDDVVAVDVDSRAMSSSTVMGLLPGDWFTLRDLLYGMMLPSGNDAALAIGRHLAGSDAAFIAEMNALAARLGLWDTRFANPHGLGARDHFTSARDLAMLSRYAMTVPGFAELVAAPSWTANGSRSIFLGNINTFLFNYPGADGLKTGYTRRAGPTLAASAVRGGHRLFVVLLNAPSRESDAYALMDWAFATFEWPAPAQGVAP